MSRRVVLPNGVDPTALAEWIVELLQAPLASFWTETGQAIPPSKIPPEYAALVQGFAPNQAKQARRPASVRLVDKTFLLGLLVQLAKVEAREKPAEQQSDAAQITTAEEAAAYLAQRQRFAAKK